MMNRPVLSGAARADAPGCPFPLKGIDLHLHSTFSDGLKTPEQLCAMAVKAGVSHLSLCDHDTAAGVPAMQKAAKKAGLVCYAGAELSTGPGGRIHILCYGEGVMGEQAAAYLAQVEHERRYRAEHILQKLEEMGLTMDEEKRQALFEQPSVGRAHIARALIAMGAVNTMQQAFDRYLGEGRPAYVPRMQLSTTEAVRTLRDMHLLPVLAHPMRMQMDFPAMHAFIRALIKEGLMGMECFHPSANARAARVLKHMARQENLLVTGGSDYHGDKGSSAHIGRLPSGWNSREADIAAFENALTHIR